MLIVSAPVEIVGLSSSTLTVMALEAIVLRCMGDETTDLLWLKDNRMVDLQQFKITLNYDPVTHRWSSLLSKEEAHPTDSGTYICRNANISLDRDTVTLTVRSEGEFPSIDAAIPVHP